MISMLVIEDSKKVILVSTKELERVTYIQYLIAFPNSVTQDDSVLNPVLALFDLSNEINIMHLAFTEK